MTESAEPGAGDDRPPALGRRWSPLLLYIFVMWWQDPRQCPSSMAMTWRPGRALAVQHRCATHMHCSASQSQRFLRLGGAVKGGTEPAWFVSAPGLSGESFLSAFVHLYGYTWGSGDFSTNPYFLLINLPFKSQPCHHWGNAEKRVYCPFDLRPAMVFSSVKCGP